jgi:arylsulfatase A-like enzyme
VSNFPGGYHYEFWPRIDSVAPALICPPTPPDGQGGHCTQANVENARTWIAAQSQPWFCMVSFQAVHGSLQWPGYGPYPDGPPLGNPPSLALAFLDAMTEHTDYWIGELLDGLEPNTLVLLMSDNGTQSAPSGLGQTVFPPYDPEHTKGSIYEHGVRVPLVVSGPGVVPGVGVPRVSDALVSLVDVYRTVTDLVGLPPLPPAIAEDSVSFAAVLANTSSGIRQTLFCESFAPNNPTSGVDNYRRSLRDDRFKLIRRWDAQVIPVQEHELYDLSVDPFEQRELILSHGGVANLPPAEAQAYQTLSAALDAIPLP